ncbi:SUMF1/EgtB/PvdO family nonheme iron enzyme [Bradyrhizobium sp.]|uniref:SUMF1/EgtB/PvdO family nonheme iron enzyme n=1 Tax=Bradyrhizobium sp. TaxID=376 RepID=UPI003BB08A20
MWFLSEPAFAEKRVALVIGNSAYQKVASLSNAARDADDMSEMFKGAGFSVVEFRRDLGVNEMRRALRDFSDDVRDADVAIVYYAGHGMEIEGTNYLIPVDATLERDIDAFDEAIPLDRVLTVIEPARQLRLVILDACRDNPFSKIIKHTIASRAVGRGLAKVEPSSPNTLIAFAAKAGSTATDGDDKNSPFTTALLKYLPRPGLDLRKAFGFVRDDVLRVTHNRQEPFIYGSLGGEDVALVPSPPQPLVDLYTAAKDDYELALQINVVSAWDSFIKRYPSGFYSDLAKAQRDKLIAAKAAAAEEARLGAQKKVLEEAQAAEAERVEAAVQAKAAQEVRIAAEKATAEEAARAAREREAYEKQNALADAKSSNTASADAAKAKAAVQAKPEEAAQIAAANTGDTRIGRETKGNEPHLSSACSEHLAALSSRAAQTLSLAEECGLKPKDAFKECENCPEMVVVPAGEVLMGSSRSDIESGLAAANEEPQHKAAIKQPFAVGRFEVTRDQYAAFVTSSGYKGSNRCYTFEHNSPQERADRSFLIPGYAQDGNHPAVCVSWVDARAYVKWLSQTTAKSYRLLSEAEFEYVARAGSTSRYGFGNDPGEICKFANGADQSAKTAGLPGDAPYMNCTDGFPFTAPVGSFAANSFGLHDLVGNVWEWTEDCFYGDYAAAKLGIVARLDGVCSTRTVRGGDWFSTEISLRPAVRAKANADAHYDDIGFRIARTLSP